MHEWEIVFWDVGQGDATSIRLPDGSFVLVDFGPSAHSEKPHEVIYGITKMFPTQRKIELFARRNYEGWENWGLEIPDSKIKIPTRGEFPL